MYTSTQQAHHLERRESWFLLIKQVVNLTMNN